MKRPGIVDDSPGNQRKAKREEAYEDRRGKKLSPAIPKEDEHVDQFSAENDQVQVLGNERDECIHAVNISPRRPTGETNPG